MIRCSWTFISWVSRVILSHTLKSVLLKCDKALFLWKRRELIDCSGTGVVPLFVNSLLRAQVTWASKIWLWIFNACFTQITSSKIERSFGSIDSFLFGEFDSVRLSNSIHGLSWIGLYRNLVRLGSIYYAGIKSNMMFEAVAEHFNNNNNIKIYSAQIP